MDTFKSLCIIFACESCNNIGNYVPNNNNPDHSTFQDKKWNLILLTEKCLCRNRKFQRNE